MRKWWIGCLRHKQQKMKDLFCVRNFTATKFWLNGLWHPCNLFSWTEYAIFLSFPNPLWNLAHGVFTLGTTGTMAIMKFIYIQKRIVIIYVCLSSSLIGKVFVSTLTELVTKQNICTCLELQYMWPLPYLLFVASIQLEVLNDVLEKSTFLLIFDTYYLPHQGIDIKDQI